MGSTKLFFDFSNFLFKVFMSLFKCLIYKNKFLFLFNKSFFSNSNFIVLLDTSFEVVIKSEIKTK